MFFAAPTERDTALARVPELSDLAGSAADIEADAVALVGDGLQQAAVQVAEGPAAHDHHAVPGPHPVQRAKLFQRQQRRPAIGRRHAGPGQRRREAFMADIGASRPIPGAEYARQAGAVSAQCGQQAPHLIMEFRVMGRRRFLVNGTDLVDIFGCQPLAQLLGFANVDDFSPGITHQITARRSRILGRWRRLGICCYA